jgi:cell division protein FtsW
MNNSFNFLKTQKIKDTIIETLVLIIFVSCCSLIKILEILGNYNKVYNIQKIFITHVLFMTVGFFIMKFLSQIHQKILKNLVLFNFIIVFISLILLIIIAPSVNGTKRWLFLLGFSIQPSFFFLTIYSYINGHLLIKEKYFKSLCIFLIVIILFMMQPDFGSSLLLLAIWASQLFILDKINYFKKYFIIIGSLFPFFLIFKGLYALKRIEFIFKPNNEINQMNIAIKAIKNSKLFFNKSFIYIPEMHNDYFFSAFTNVYGVIASISLISLSIYFIYNLLESIKYQTSPLKQSIIFGYTIFVGSQWCLHLFTNLNLIPAKGISFPFISAGGSLIIANFIGLGIVMNLLNSSE